MDHDSFKQRFLKLRETLEEFKDNHKMASQAISRFIEESPWPFNSFLGTVWSGIEKQDDSAVKMLQTLKNIEDNNEDAFREIEGKISELISTGAKSEDLTKLGTEIGTSNQSILKLIDDAMVKVSEVLGQLENNFRKDLQHQRLSRCNLRFVTALSVGAIKPASLNCWRNLLFHDADIQSGYDVRRPIVNRILDSIKNNFGTVIFGEAFVGKSMILKRVKYEAAKNDGYIVLYSDELRGNESEFISIVEDIIGHYSKVVVIIDNLHRNVSRFLLKILNSMEHLYINGLRFLLSARREELYHSLRISSTNYMNIEESKDLVNSFDIKLTPDDAKLFIEKAVSFSSQVKPTKNEIKELIDVLYIKNKADPLFFLYDLSSYLTKGTTSISTVLFEDFDEKIIRLGDDIRLWKCALLCSFVGMFGIKLHNTLLGSCIAT